MNEIISYSLTYRRRKKFKPNISVAIHHDDGHTEVERVDLIPTLQQHDVQIELQTDNEQFMPELDDAERSEEGDINETTSLYYQKVEKKQRAWEELRCEALRKIFQFAGQKSCLCVSCGKEDASFRCQDCAHAAMFCEECVLNMHRRVNLYHNVEVLRVCYLFLYF